MLKKNKNITFLYSGGFFLNHRGSIIGKTPAFYSLWDRAFQTVRAYCRTSSIVHRRNIRTRWNEEECTVAEDWDFCNNAARDGTTFHSLLPRRTVYYSTGKTTRSMAFVRSSSMLALYRFSDPGEADARAAALNRLNPVLAYHSAAFTDAMRYWKTLIKTAARCSRMDGSSEGLLQEITAHYRERIVHVARTHAERPLFITCPGENCHYLGLPLPPLTFSHLREYIIIHRSIFPRTCSTLETLLASAGMDSPIYTIEKTGAIPRGRQ